MSSSDRSSDDGNDRTVTTRRTKRQRRKPSSTTMSNKKQNESGKEEPLVVIDQKCSYRELLWLVSKLPVCSSSSSSDSQDQEEDDDDRELLPPEILRRIANWLTVDRVNPNNVKAIRASSTDGRHPLRCSLEENESTWWISRVGSMPRGHGEEFVEYQLSSPTTTKTKTNKNKSKNDQNNTNNDNKTTSSLSLSASAALASGSWSSNNKIKINKKPNNEEKVVRLSKFSIEIPPLPMGPLSVRTLRLDCKCLQSSSSSNSGGGEVVAVDEWKQVSPIWNIENKTGWQSFSLQNPVDTEYVRVVCLTNQISTFLPRNLNDNGIIDVDAHSCVGYYHVKFE